MQRNAGFTLIELLVVVLIIGILSAVALPQYQKAVMKTRALSFLPMLRSINDAEQIYYLANGTYTISFDDLDISLPPGATVTRTANEEILTYSNNWKCSLWRSGEGGSHSAYCFSTLAEMPQIEKYFERDYYICWTAPDSKGYEVCQTIANRSTPNTTKPTGKGFFFN